MWAAVMVGLDPTMLNHRQLQINALMLMGLLVITVAAALVSLKVMKYVEKMMQKEVEAHAHAFMTGTLRTEMEIETILDSPEPTRMTRTPSTWKSSMRTMRRVPKRAQARRGGRRMRITGHRRCLTQRWDPTTPGECAYSCLLRAAGIKESKEELSHLRACTSQVVKTMFLDDEYVGEVGVRNLINQSGHTLNAYLAQVRHRQWASIVEACAAALVLGIAVYFADGDMIQKIGVGNAKYILRLHSGHFTLRAWHRKVPKGVHGMSPMTGGAAERQPLEAPQGRGGMRREHHEEDQDDEGEWDWEREDVQPPPRPMIIRVDQVVPPPQQNWAWSGAPQVDSL